jgi:hypothetical protein
MADRYTKWMLTIIATTLVVIAAHDVVYTAVAQNWARVQICDAQNCMDLYPVSTTVQGRTGIIWGLPVVRTN